MTHGGTGNTFMEHRTATPERPAMPTTPTTPNTATDTPDARHGNGASPTLDHVIERVRHAHVPDAIAHPGRRLDLAAYGLLIAGIYGLLGPLFFMGGKEKIFFAVPDGITKMFSGTFVSSFPGTGVAWFLVGLLEMAVVALLAVSLIRGEFLPSRTKPWLLTSIALSMFAYAVVAFGDTITNTFAGTASLYTYFATTGVMFVLVLLMPPYRPAAWLSSLVGR
jgi:hypothetical protein